MPWFLVGINHWWASSRWFFAWIPVFVSLPIEPVNSWLSTRSKRVQWKLQGCDSPSGYWGVHSRFPQVGAVQQAMLSLSLGPWVQGHPQSWKLAKGQTGSDTDTVSLFYIACLSKVYYIVWHWIRVFVITDIIGSWRLANAKCIHKHVLYIVLYIHIITYI